AGGYLWMVWKRRAYLHNRLQDTDHEPLLTGAIPLKSVRDLWVWYLGQFAPIRVLWFLVSTLWRWTCILCRAAPPPPTQVAAPAAPPNVSGIVIALFVTGFAFW